MYIVDDYIPENLYGSENFRLYFDEARLAVFDIETTGLVPGRSKIIIGGILTPDVNGVRIRQFFSEGNNEEAELLDLYTGLIQDSDVVFSYNGDRFDIPFINSRLKAQRRSEVFSDCLSIDLYKAIKYYSDFATKLPNLKQPTVENYLNLRKNRTDQITGADSVRMYYKYLASRSNTLKRFMLLHNSDDVLQLSRLLKVFDVLDIHKIVAHMGFPVIDGESTLFVDRIRMNNNSLEFSGRYKSMPFDYIVYNDTYQAAFRNNESSFYVKLPCLKEKGAVFADLTELGIPDEDFKDQPCFQSGYVILKNKAVINYQIINHVIKLTLKNLLKKMKK